MLTSLPASAASSVLSEAGRLEVRELGRHIPLLHGCALHLEVASAQGLTLEGQVGPSAPRSWKDYSRLSPAVPFLYCPAKA